MEAADNDKAITLAQKSASKLSIFGGSFPVTNPKAFSAVDLKLLKNVRPRLVVDVPRDDAEKRMKVSRTPLILKHLRNNWIWHCKNGQENLVKSIPSARKRRRSDEMDTAAIDERDWGRYRRFQTMLRNLEVAEEEDEDQPGNSSPIIRLGEERKEERPIRNDFLMRQLEEDGQQSPQPGTSTSMPNGQPPLDEAAKRLHQRGLSIQGEGDTQERPKQTIQSMAARAMEDDEQQPAEHLAHCGSGDGSSGAANVAMPMRRRTSASAAARVRRAPMDDGDEAEASQEGSEPPPTKLGRTG